MSTKIKTPDGWKDVVGSGEEQYSTTEVYTGKRWIDGKPIYRKTVSVSAISNTLENPNVIATNVANLVKAYGDVVFVPWGNTTRTSFPAVVATNAAGGYTATVLKNGTLGIFYSVHGQPWVFKDAVITVEYTKTTD